MADGYVTAPGAAPTPVEAPKPDLAALKAMFEEFVRLTANARSESEKDRDYFDGAQWTAAERAALQARKQPDNVFNRIRPAIEGTIGVIDQGQTDPKAWPRNPDDEQAADVATKVLRYIEDYSRFDRTKMDAAENYFVEGTCAVLNEMDENREVYPCLIRWEEFVYDPRSRRKDFGDARYLGIAKWRYSDEVAAEYQQAASELENAVEGGGGAGAGGMGDQSFLDRPQDATTTVAWVDKAKRRLMVVEIYYRQGADWFRAVFHTAGLLDYGPSAYRKQRGGSRCPIEAASCYIDRQNQRYGKVRDMRGPQDEINKRRSKALHHLSVSQIQPIDGAFVAVDVEEARREAARPDGVIPPGYQRVPAPDIISGQLQLLAEAKAEIERMGPNPAILGRQGADASGRSALIRQQAGMTELAPTMGVFEDFELRCYRQMWENARQFWREPKFVRITDENGKPAFVGLNQPQMAPHPLTGQPMPTGQVANPIAEIDVDITIETTPDTANLQQEQFQGLLDLMKYGFQIPPSILIKASSLPDKQALLDELDQASSQPDPMKQIALEGAAANVDKTKAEAALTAAKVDTELAKPHVDAFDARQPAVVKPPPGLQQMDTQNG